MGINLNDYRLGVDYTLDRDTGVVTFTHPPALRDFSFTLNGYWNPDPASEAIGQSTDGGVPDTPRPRGYTFPQADQEHIIAVNKRTHRIRFQNETEGSVEIVIEPKDTWSLV